MSKSGGRLKGAVKWATIVISGVAMAGVVLMFFLLGKPPREEKFIENFHAHQSAYERLRTMLLADNQLDRVGGWGVESDNQIGIHIPPEGGFPADQYHEYLSLLKEVGAAGAYRGRGEHPDRVCILVWAAGWGGDTRHVATCWLEHEPSNQVASLAAFYQTPKPRNPVFRHVEGNWYLWTDW